MGQRVYITLEGGGAKGIAHVGALKAVVDAAEDDGSQTYEVVGISGTSAGAIVAGLFAAGYDPEEIASSASDDNILKFVDNANIATDLLPAPGWERLNQVRKLTRGGFGAMVVGAYLIAFALLVLAAPPVVGALYGLWFGLGAAVVSVCVSVGAFIYLTAGIASLRTFRNAYGVALAKKLGLPHIPEGVTFGVIASQGRAPLKVVATNLSTGSIELFSAETTPDVPVADAVIASGSIPVAFRSWPIRRGLPEKRIGRYYDGGLLSNLPTWVFDDERAIDRDAWSLAIEVGDGVGELPAHGDLSSFGKLVRFLRTTVFGSASLNKRNISKLIEIPLNTDIGVLDLDLTKEEVRALVQDAYGEAKDVLDREAILRAAPKTIAEEFAQLLKATGFPAWSQTIRVTVTPIPQSVLSAVSLGRHKGLSVRLRYHHGFEDSADEYLAIPIDGSFLGRALVDQAISYDTVDTRTTGFVDTERRLRWLQKFVNRDLKWIASLPLFYRVELSKDIAQDRAYVITIDGDDWDKANDDLYTAAFEQSLELMHQFLPAIIGVDRKEHSR